MNNEETKANKSGAMLRAPIPITAKYAKYAKGRMTSWRVAHESRNKAEQPAGLCGKRRNIRRNRIGFVPPFYGFSRLFTAIGRKKVQFGGTLALILAFSPLEKETDGHALETDCT